MHENRRRVAAVLDLDPAQVAGVTQVHGADVWVDLGAGADVHADVRWDSGPSPVEADALVTARADVGLAVGVADCVPIGVVWGSAVAAIHGGWRSLDHGVVEATLRALAHADPTASLMAGFAPRAVIGPCLGACCMEVGADVAARFDPRVVLAHDDGDKQLLDLRADARLRLEAAGVGVDDIVVCTRDDERCFSHRGDGGSTGRQALLIRRT